VKAAALFSLAAVSLAWAGARGADAPHFRVDILPILTKAGCNAGACHGAATGQGGFKLSLLGYDPEDDHERITRELGGRRIAIARPDDSLLLRKPAGVLEHEGGRKLRRDGADYALVRRWIAAGAPLGSQELHVASIDVEPASVLFATTNANRRLRVTARLSDGSRRDVTRQALFQSNDDAIAEVSRTGEITAIASGLTSIMVRYGGQVAAARVAMPYPNPPPAGAQFETRNYIDEHIGTELERLRVTPSPMSSDAEFLRRVHLDVTGRLPGAQVARVFLAGPPSARDRERLTDQLLSSEAFVDFWTLKLADWLLLNGTGDGVAAYYVWLRAHVASNTPLDRLVRELLTASGELARVGPANFFTLAADPRDLAEHASRMFLGTQIACARCHAHPSDRWTQDDYYAFAAYFARVTRDAGRIEIAARGDVPHPKTGQPSAPKPLGATLPELPSGADRRPALAAWLTAADNPRFARALANRVWRHLLGRGLVEPVDDLRPTNPPTHPALLDALAADLTAARFDLRHLIRRIVQSRTYQLSSRSLGASRQDRQLYSHALFKPLPGPVFADAVTDVTGVADAFEGYPAGTRAVQLASPATPAPALDLLGRCLRTTPCDSSPPTGGGLAAALHLIHGATINGKLRGAGFDDLSALDNNQFIEELYLRALSRFPTPQEFTEWHGLLARTQPRVEGVQDLVWTVLNSREFAFNH
jgi:hypothetical protein